MVHAGTIYSCQKWTKMFHADISDLTDIWPYDVEELPYMYQALSGAL